MTALLQRIGVRYPIIQAPMAGVATPALAAAVSNAGALGSLGIGSSTVEQAARMIADFRGLCSGPLNVNVFAHRTTPSDPVAEADWLAAMAPLFAECGARPPEALHPGYPGFHDDERIFALLLAAAPEAVSFHFGLPTEEQVRALKAMGAVLIASATSLGEAQAIRAAGLDAVIAQGIEAGGHRGFFDPDARDERLSTMTLTRLLVQESGLPVIAAGGIMDGAGISATLRLGAVAAQLGTAFVSCPESAADAAYRAALLQAGEAGTVLTPAISGRPARGLVNRLTAWGESNGLVPPGYPVSYDAAKALIAAARKASVSGFAAHWAGQGAALSRALPAAELVARLVAEIA